MGQVIALDSMIFIYLLERDERYAVKVDKLFEKTEAGEIGMVTSIISLIEVLSSSKLSDKEAVRIEISRFFQETPGLSVFLPEYEIGLLAAELRRENKSLRTPDAIQLATAVVGGASMFLTNDIKLTKVKLDSLKIMMIDEFEV